MNNAMYEHPATQANLATLARARRDRAGAGDGPLGSPGEFGVGRLPEPPELLAAVEARCWPAARCDGANVLVTRGRHARADRRRALRRQPLVAGAWGSRWPRRPSGAAPTSRSSPPTCRSPRAAGIEYVDVADRRRARRCLRCALRRVRRADDGRRRRRLPARGRARRQAQEGPDRRGTEPALSSVPRTCSPRSPTAAAPASCSSGSPPSTATARWPTAATSSSARNWTRSS